MRGDRLPVPAGAVLFLLRGIGGNALDSPIYHLEGVVKAKTEDMEDFVGPLDLILHLLSKNKMEIKDIQISLILDQYLAWMAAARRWTWR